MKTKQLPTGWEEVELSKVIKLRGGYAFKSEKFVEQGIPIIRISNFDNNNVNLSGVVYYSKEDSRTYNEFLLKENDILIAMSGATTGKIGVIIKENEPCLLNQRVGKFEIIDKNIFFKYLLMFVKSSEFQKKVFNIASGCAQPNISGKQIESIKIPLPPLPIQKQIVSILEKAEALKQRREKADKLTKEYLKSVFAEMFGDPERNNKNWPKSSLKDVAEVVRESVTPEKIQDNEKYIGLEDIESESGRIIKINNISKGELKSNKFVFDSNFVLYGKLRPYLNKIVLPNFKGICSTDVLPIRPLKNKSDRYYLAFLLRNRYYIQLATDRSVGANLPRLSPKTLEYFEVPLPPLPLQQKFANIVEKVEKLKEKQKQSKEEINIMFDALMQKAFKGELVKDGKK